MINKKGSTKTKKIFLSLFLILSLVSQNVSAMPTMDVLKNPMDMANKIMDGILKAAGGVATSMISTAMNKFASDFAKWSVDQLATGGNGKQPLYFNLSLEDMLKNASDNAIGAALDEAGDAMSRDLCKPIEVGDLPGLKSWKFNLLLNVFPDMTVPEMKIKAPRCTLSKFIDATKQSLNNVSNAIKNAYVNECFQEFTPIINTSTASNTLAGNNKISAYSDIAGTTGVTDALGGVASDAVAGLSSLTVFNIDALKLNYLYDGRSAGVMKSYFGTSSTLYYCKVPKKLINDDNAKAWNLKYDGNPSGFGNYTGYVPEASCPSQFKVVDPGFAGIGYKNACVNGDGLILGSGCMTNSDCLGIGSCKSVFGLTAFINTSLKKCIDLTTGLDYSFDLNTYNPSNISNGFYCQSDSDCMTRLKNSGKSAPALKCTGSTTPLTIKLGSDKVVYNSKTVDGDPDKNKQRKFLNKYLDCFMPKIKAAFQGLLTLGTIPAETQQKYEVEHQCSWALGTLYNNYGPNNVYGNVYGRLSFYEDAKDASKVSGLLSYVKASSSIFDLKSQDGVNSNYQQPATFQEARNSYSASAYSANIDGSGNIYPVEFPSKCLTMYITQSNDYSYSVLGSKVECGVEVVIPSKLSLLGKVVDPSASENDIYVYRKMKGQTNSDIAKNVIKLNLKNFVDVGSSGLFDAINSKLESVSISLDYPGYFFSIVGAFGGANLDGGSVKTNSDIKKIVQSLSNVSNYNYTRVTQRSSEPEYNFENKCNLNSKNDSAILAYQEDQNNKKVIADLKAKKEADIADEKELVKESVAKSDSKAVTSPIAGTIETPAGIIDATLIQNSVTDVMSTLKPDTGEWSLITNPIKIFLVTFLQSGSKAVMNGLFNSAFPTDNITDELKKLNDMPGTKNVLDQSSITGGSSSDSSGTSATTVVTNSDGSTTTSATIDGSAVSVTTSSSGRTTATKTTTSPDGTVVVIRTIINTDGTSSSTSTTTPPGGSPVTTVLATPVTIIIPCASVASFTALAGACCQSNFDCASKTCSNNKCK